MKLYADQLIKIMPFARNRADKWLSPLNAAMAEFDIVTPRRMAPFLANVAQESGELRYVLELASGAAYDTGRLAQRLGNTPAADGDGQRYKGRGLIQITGQANYAICSQALFGDPALLIDHPERLEETEVAARSAAWFWQSNGLNTLADQANSFQIIVRRINGGLTHYPERLMYFERAKLVLGA